ncbi:MAG: thiamine-phosphate kinase [Gammaproteobacteria bacterium]|nr:thiamine-phosphate kinase [Gammaproteobacteria bacterium]MDE0444854.1 thiamine-phosphate kinase [Gammaproteobacteria bacterium]
MADAVHEFELIERIVARLRDTARGDGVVLGPGDDAAVLEIPTGHQFVVSTDTLVADRHYPGGACADAIGYRSLAVATSDLAAMGATPAFATVSLTAENLTVNWAEHYAGGLATAARDFGITIVGGNIARGPESVTVTVHGHTPGGMAITRSGAKPGEVLYVTGSLGGAGLALADENLGEWSLVALKEDSPLKRYWMPRPRLELGIGLRGIASAAIDISDGLSSDLDHLCRASGVGCDVDLDAIPLYAGATALDAVAMGDDYELALAAPPDVRDTIADLAQRHGIPITPIATLRKDANPGAGWTQGGTLVEVRPGYRHF